MKKLLTSFLAVSLTSIGATPSIADEAGDDTLRAAMIINFVRYADWPADRFASATAPVVVCVESNTSLGSALERLDGKDVGVRRLHIEQRALSRFDDDCHVAVASGKPGTERVRALTSQGILTIGDAPGFAQGGVIELIQVGRQTRFKINNNDAARSGIKLRSQLLRLALEVD